LIAIRIGMPIHTVATKKSAACSSARYESNID